MAYPALVELNVAINENNVDTKSLYNWYPLLTYPAVDVAFDLDNTDYLLNRDEEIYMAYKIWHACTGVYTAGQVLFPATPPGIAPLIKATSKIPAIAYTSFEDFLEVLYLQSITIIESSNHVILEPRGFCELFIEENLVYTYASPDILAITALPLSGKVPLTVDFSPILTSTSGPITSWDWHFGDGTNDSLVQNTYHTYGAPGSYTVSLTVTGIGGSSLATTTITVTG